MHTTKNMNGEIRGQIGRTAQLGAGQRFKGRGRPRGPASPEPRPCAP